MKLFRKWRLPGSLDTVSVYIPTFPKLGFDRGFRIYAHGKLWKDSFRSAVWYGRAVQWSAAGHDYVLVLDNSGFSSAKDLYLFVDGCEVQDGARWRTVWTRLFVHRVVIGLLCLCVAAALLSWGHQIHLLQRVGVVCLGFGLFHVIVGVLGVVGLFVPCCHTQLCWFEGDPGFRRSRFPRDSEQSIHDHFWHMDRRLAYTSSTSVSGSEACSGSAEESDGPLMLS